MFQQAEKIAGILIISTLLLTSCGQKTNTEEHQQFTKIDSLTEKYLAYNDSILQAWNVMINDDNQKIKTMRYLVNVLLESNEVSHDELAILNERIDLLFENRYTPESLNEARIEEYDFASNALITEVTTQIKNYSKFEESEKLQKLVDEIIAADQRVEKYRSDYDAIVEQYNQFLEINQPTIEATEGLDWNKKIRFSY
jgi:hypothetical protein